MKNIFLFILLSFFSLIVFADNETEMTLSSLEKEGYVPMDGAEISSVILDKTVLIKDLLSQAVYKVNISADGTIKKQVIKRKDPKILTSVEYSSRAPILTETVDMAIKGNKIIVTDGVRTYISTLYKKDEFIYGIRDIDHDVVNFQIILK